MPHPNRMKGTPEYEAYIRKQSESHKGQISHSKGKPGHKHTPEARAKISASTKGRPSNTKGHKLTEEHKAKLSAVAKGKPPNNKGKPRSAKARAKASASMTGHDTSSETRAKIGAKHKDKVVSAEARKNIGVASRATWDKMTDEQKAKKVALLSYSSKTSKESWIERFVAQRFDAQGIIYERQKRIGWYRVDFYIPAENRIVEVNGCYWHACEHCGKDLRKDNREADAKRYAYLRGKGYTVEVIWEHELPRKPP